MNRVTKKRRSMFTTAEQLGVRMNRYSFPFNGLQLRVAIIDFGQDLMGQESQATIILESWEEVPAGSREIASLAFLHWLQNEAGYLVKKVLPSPKDSDWFPPSFLVERGRA